MISIKKDICAEKLIKESNKTTLIRKIPGAIRRMFRNTKVKTKSLWSKGG